MLDGSELPGGDSLRDSTLSEQASRAKEAILPAEVRDELRHILEAVAFRRSESSSRLLQTLVEYTLAGRVEELKEYSLALEVFDRRPSFDPRVDPIVRVEAGRLRKKLAAYYETEGRESPLRIAVPLRRYGVSISRQTAPQTTAPSIAPATPHPETRKLRGWTWILPVVPVLIVISAGAVWEKRPSAVSRATAVNAASIAVIPFSDLSRDSTQELLSDALTEEVIEALSHVHGLRVISRLGSYSLKGKTEDTGQIGRRLGVRYILEGSLNRSGRRVRVIARLVDAANGYRLWSKSFVRDLEETPPFEEPLAHMIVDELRQQLGMAFRHPFTEGRSPRPDAYQSYLKGVSFSRRWSVGELRKSVEFFDRAAAEDAGFAPAWAGLADAHVLLALAAGAQPDSLEKARIAANRAIALDSNLASAHASVAFVKAVCEWDWRAAEREFRLAHELDPADARIHEAWVLAYLVPMGQFDEALKQIHEAQELEPVSVRIVSAVGAVHFFRREYDRAIEFQRKALELDSTFFPAHLVLANAFAAKGMAVEAAAALEKWTAAAGSRLTMPATRELLLPWLEDAARQHLTVATQLNAHPRFDSLRSDPRFRSLVSKVGLSPF